MAINNEFPILDGFAPSWGDMSCLIRGTTINALEMRDINAINTNSTRERGEQRNAGGEVVRRTVGQTNRESSLTLYRYGAQNLMRNLLAGAQELGLVRGNQPIISLVAFTIDYKHSPPGSDEIFQRILRGCMVDGMAINTALGTDAQTVEVPISTIQIVDVIDGIEVTI